MRPRYIVTNTSGLFLAPGERPWKVVAKTSERSWAVSMHDDIADARAEVDRLNFLEEGLHRIAVAVAVWGAMAAMAAMLLSEERLCWSDGVALGRALERESRRKWGLRLRSRRESRASPATRLDLLAWRARERRIARGPHDWGRTWWLDRPIYGPRGVLP